VSQKRQRLLPHRQKYPLVNIALSPSEIDSQQRQTTKPKQQFNETSHALRGTVNKSAHHELPQTSAMLPWDQECCRYAARIYPAK